MKPVSPETGRAATGTNTPPVAITAPTYPTIRRDAPRGDVLVLSLSRIRGWVPGRPGLLKEELDMAFQPRTEGKSRAVDKEASCSQQVLSF